MNLPEPAWKVKTRPCSFYRKRRCLFNDSCNFIHDASVPSTVETIPDKSSVSGQEDESRTPPNLPKVIIESPLSLRSPNRSPRTTSLLLALRDVIGDIDEPGASSWSESLPTLVNENGFEQPDTSSTSDGNDQQTEEEPTTDEANWTAVSDYSDEDTISMPIRPKSEQDTLPNSNGSSSHGDISLPEVAENRSSVTTERTSGLLSPIEIATLNLGPFRRSLGSCLSIDINASDTQYWKPPTPLQSSPPRSPSIASTFGLIPSPFGSHTTRILSPRLSMFMPGSPLSPSMEPLDLGLDSPRDRTESLTSTSLKDVVDSWNNRAPGCETQDDADDFSTEDDFILQESALPWDAESQTAIYTGFDPGFVREQVSDAIKKASRTPTYFLTSQEISFSEIEPEHSSSFLDDDDTHGFLDEDACISVPRLLDNARPDCSNAPTAGSPYSRAGQNTSFNSLCDVHSGIVFRQNVLADSVRNARLSPLQTESLPLSNISTPASSLRERVFTPPPHPPFSGLICAEPLGSVLGSPLTSVDHVSSRASPFLLQEDKASPPSSLKEGKSNVPTESKKVPLASRSSFAGRRAGASLLSSNQSFGSAIPPLPLERGASALTSPTQSAGSSTSSIDSAKPMRLKPLHLSAAINSEHLSRSSLESSTFANSFRHSRNRMSNSSASVSSSTYSITNNHLLSSSKLSSIPLRIRSYSPLHFENMSRPRNEPLSTPLFSRHNSTTRPQPSSGLFEPQCECEPEAVDTTGSAGLDEETLRQPLLSTAPVSRTHSVSQAPSAIETPRPTLMFAIASDNVEQVKQVLESGGVDPNEAVGPQSALAFTLTNDKLTNKLEIVKALLAYGADPESVKKAEVLVPESEDLKAEGKQQKPLLEELDHATKYYLDRADAMHTKRSSALIQRSFFRPLTHVCYELIGQDRALEQLFRVLSMKSWELTVAPIVVMLCGPSGHGKSLLARKFGLLLDVPTHTVNMTTLSSSYELWQSYSMSPYEDPSTCTLAEFLVNNEGRRCVVILDEIEKSANEKILWSLYMPWELGRYALESSGRHVDVRNVVWLGTSNIGHDLIFNHQETRKNPEEIMSREEYLEVMALLRSKVSERLGASVLSRVSTVLPFVPFTLEEKKAICAEALGRLAGDTYRRLESTSVESLINSAVAEYYPAEGVRSLHRSISNQLLDIL